MAGVDPLLELLAECVVPVYRDGRFEGSGFWVAPRELLTCAHVAHGGKPLVVGPTSLPAEPISPLLDPADPAAEYYPQPDVALLRVPDAPPGHLCVRLDPTVPPVGDLLQLTAFTDREYGGERVDRSGATLGLETLFEHDGVTLFKLREGQVIGGFSGGPLLHRRSGTVCGLNESSRDINGDLGGFGVPTALFEQVVPGLLARNAAFHKDDHRWSSAAEAQRVADAERTKQPHRSTLRPTTTDKSEFPSSFGEAFVRVGRPPMLADAYQERRSVREQIWGSVSRNPINGFSDTVILRADGGTGKTQIAAQIWSSTWNRDNYSTPYLVAWVSASTRSAIQSGYARAARVLNISADTDENLAAESFLTWLAATDQTWLVVLDGLADPRDLVKLWPFTSNPKLSGGGARVLVTTRRQDDSLFGHGRRRIEIPSFTPEESVRYLEQRLIYSRRLLGWGGRREVEALALDLRHLPLALSQASAYLLSKRTSVIEYRELLSGTRLKLDKLMPANYGDDHERTIQETWELAIEQANSLNPVGAAAHTARLIAVLDPDGVPEEVLTAGPARNRPEGASLTVDEVRLVIFNLHDVGIVSYDTDGPYSVVRMHALAQRATRERADGPELSHAVSSAADSLLEAWPDTDVNLDLVASFRACAASLLRPHATLWQNGAHPLFRKLSSSLGENGLLSAAVDWCTSTVATSTELLGLEHPDTLTARHELAYWQGVAGNPRGAAQSFESLHRDCLRILGPDHPNTLAALSRMALWRGQAGDADDAIAMFDELVISRTRVLGPDHPDTFRARHDLAYWRGGAGYPQLAVSGLGDLLEDRVRVLGPEHPDTLFNRSHLALYLGEAGNAEQAVNEFSTLLHIRMRIWGDYRHPKILSNRFNVARWTGEAGDPTDAVEQFETLVEDSVEILGRDHPQTLDTRRELACWRGEKGDSGRAVEELSRILIDALSVLGPDHPRTLAIRSNLAAWTGKSGEPQMAVNMLVELAADASRVFTGDHPETLVMLTDLARWRGYLGDSGPAISQFQSVLDTYSRRLKNDHPKVLEIKSCIAWWQGESGEPEVAATTFRDLAEIYSRTLGPEHPRTVEARRNGSYWADRLT